LAKPETEAAFLATPPDSGRQRPRYHVSPTAKPRKVKDYSNGRQETGFAQDWVVVCGVVCEPVSDPKFPIIRENNREISRIQPPVGCQRRKSALRSAVYDPIPYRP
jgi:hypothetical protein